MSGPESITAVVLAGGLGSRLRPVVTDRPKVLAEVRGRPFITYILDQLDQAGLPEVVLCTGYLADTIRESLGETYKSLNLKYSRERQPLGTGGALRQALDQCLYDPVLVLNGDSFIEFDPVGYLQWFEVNHLEAAMLLTMVHDASRYGRVMLRENGRIESFAEKTENHDPGLINAGVYLLRKRIISSIPSGEFYSLEQQLFPQLQDERLYGYLSTGKFIDIGTPESYSAAPAFFKDKG